MVWNPTPNEESIRIFTRALLEAGKITGVENVEAFVTNALDLTLLEEAQR
jgi:hypothetical protein